MTIWVLADIAVLAFVAFMCTHSMKRGFLKSSYSGVASLLTIALVFCLHTSFEGYIENSVIGDTVRDKIRISVQASLYAGNAENAESTAEAAEKIKLPGFLEDLVADAVNAQKQNVGEIKENVTESITEIIFPFVMKILSVALLYILIRLTLKLIFIALKLIFEIPILGMADKLLGAALGGINALLIIYFFSALLMLLTPVDLTNTLESGINSGFLYKYFYYNNIIITMLLG